MILMILLFETPNTPIWLVIVVGALGALGTFWREAKSSYDTWHNNRTSLKSKEIETEAERIARQTQEHKTLRERIRELEKHNNANENKLLQMQTAIRTMVPLMRIIMKNSPDYSHLIDSLEKLAADDI